MNASSTQSVISLQTIFESYGELLLASVALKGVLQSGVVKWLQIFIPVQGKFDAWLWRDTIKPKNCKFAARGSVNERKHGILRERPGLPVGCEVIERPAYNHCGHCIRRQ